MAYYTGLMERIVSVSQQCDKVVAVAVIGSQARKENRADEYSDLDLIMVVTDSEDFLSSDDWFRQLGTVQVSFCENTLAGQKEKRILFDDAQDVDFVLVPQSDAEGILENADCLQFLGKGCKVLVDKQGLFGEIPPSADAGHPYCPPTEEEFINQTSDFWYHTVWATKKLLRGELWAAKFCIDSYMKFKLLWVLEHYEHLTHGDAYNTWYGGRFVDRWADNVVTEKLAKTFAHYDHNDMITALLETMELYRFLATEVSRGMGFSYPRHADAYTSAWVIENMRKQQ